MSWICKKCETENPDERDVCEVCDAQAPVLSGLYYELDYLYNIVIFHWSPWLCDKIVFEYNGNKVELHRFENEYAVKFSDIIPDCMKFKIIYFNSTCERQHQIEDLKYKYLDVEALLRYSLFKPKSLKIRAIAIPNTIRTIENYLFSNCSSLKHVFIPESVKTIGVQAFKGCTSLKQIVLPSTTEWIGAEAFSGCISLEQLVIPNSVTSIGRRVFENCTSLKQVIISSSITDMGNGFFYGCSSLKSVIIPDSVEHIWPDTFSGCSNLKEIFIPKKVKAIGEYVFLNCDNLVSIVVDSKNQVYDSRDNCNAVILTSENKLLYGCASTIIPDSVTAIGVSAFSLCRKLFSITIPKSITRIERFAFSGCESLQSITITDSVETIEDGAFSGCVSLFHISLPDSLREIGEGVFSGCYALQRVYIPSSISIIRGNLFNDMIRDDNYNTREWKMKDYYRHYGGLTDEELKNYKLPRQEMYFVKLIKVSKDNCVFDSRNNCNAIIETRTNSLLQACSATIIPDSVVCIGKFAFASCGIENVKIPQSVKHICEFAFARCEKLTYVSLPSIKLLEKCTFIDCCSLQSIELPDTLESIGEKAFSGCTSLNGIHFPEGLLEIQGKAFEDCSSLISVDIPQSLQSLADNAFAGCTSLSFISVASGNRNYDSRDNCNAIIESASNRLMIGCENTVIPDSVEEIGDNAFWGSEPKELRIPKSVKRISYLMCSGSVLRKIYIPKENRHLIDDLLYTIEYAKFADDEVEIPEIIEY